MRHIRKEMTYKMPHILFWLGILLPAMGAIPFSNNSSAVKTGLVVTKMMTAQRFFSKNSQKRFTAYFRTVTRIESGQFIEYKIRNPHITSRL